MFNITSFWSGSKENYRAQVNKEEEEEEEEAEEEGGGGGGGGGEEKEEEEKHIATRTSLSLTESLLNCSFVAVVIKVKLDLGHAAVGDGGYLDIGRRHWQGAHNVGGQVADGGKDRVGDAVRRVHDEHKVHLWRAPWTRNIRQRNYHCSFID